MLVVSMGAAAHRTEAVERGCADPGGEVAVRCAAYALADQRSVAEAFRDARGAGEQRGGGRGFQRWSIGSAVNLEAGALEHPTERIDRRVDPLLLGRCADAHID